MKLIDTVSFHCYRWSLEQLHPLRSVFFEISGTCNLNCLHCYIPTSQKHHTLPAEEIEKALCDITLTWGRYIGIAITGGEPLLHPDFITIITNLYKHHFTWSLATNGTLINQSWVDFLLTHGCKAITISLDGGNNAHNVIRNNPQAYVQTLKALHLLYPYRDRIRLMVTSVIWKDNVKQLPDLAKVLEPFPDITWRISPLLYCENVRKNKLLLDKKTYTEIITFYLQHKDINKQKMILGEQGTLVEKYRTYFDTTFDFCQAGLTTFGVLCNGDIVGCMVNRNNKLGNIFNGDILSSVWQQHQDASHQELCPLHFQSETSLHKQAQ